MRHRDRVIAETHRPKMLFETSLPVRYYLPLVDVDTCLLQPSATVSHCPYKGEGRHWHLDAEDELVEDAVWSLPHPLAEGLPAAQHIGFYPDKVSVEVDGQPLRP